MGERRLLFFFDGSANSVGSPKNTLPTNIYRLNRAFTFGFQGVPQITFYFSGVGTRGDHVSAATGRGFDQIVAEGYVNLASNYMEGDTVYVFGYSRGAAAARALTGLLSDPGLLPADDLETFPEIWRYFLTEAVSQEGAREVLRNRFRAKVFKPRPKVKFLGVFDTVPGTSWDTMNLFTKVRFQGFDLDASVDAAVHILAIDDDRKPSFSPLLWRRKSRPEQIMEQIWLPGVHADIGGCSDGRVIGNVALLTMLDRIALHCPELELDGFYIDTVRDALLSARSIAISSERPGVVRKFLRRGKREIGKTGAESCGKLFDLLKNQEITIRGRIASYEPNNVAELPVTATSEDGLFERVVSQLLEARLSSRPD